MMMADDEEGRVTEQLDQITKLLNSIRLSIAAGVSRSAVAELRDDIQSLTSAVHILSSTLKRRAKKAAKA